MGLDWFRVSVSLTEALLKAEVIRWTGCLHIGDLGDTLAADIRGDAGDWELAMELAKEPATEFMELPPAVTEFMELPPPLGLLWIDDRGTVEPPI